MDPSPSAARPALRPDLRVHEVDGELLLFEPDAASLHHVDRIGSALLPHLDGSTAMDELAVDAAAAFGTDVEVVQHRLTELVRQLDRAGLLVGFRPAFRAAGPTLLPDPPSP